MTFPVWLGVLVVGGIGAVARFRLDRWVTARIGGGFPTGTLGVNLSGATILGILTSTALPASVVLVAGTGLIGAYTTFSTWMLETQRLAEERQYRRAAINVVVSVTAGVLAAGIGQAIGERL